MAALAQRGARVVLVMATAGDLGTPLAPLPAGRDVAAHRQAELEQACDLLGVSRLVLLGRRDSGLPGWSEHEHPGALVQADPARLARQIADLCAAERAEALVHYDSDGITRHPDHLAVHRVGALAARLAGVAEYEATIDREHLHFTGEHLVDGGALPGRRTAGRVTAEITTAFAAPPEVLATKRAAMAAHASQIPLAHLDTEWFAEAYGLEWFRRTGRPGLLEQLGNAHALAG
jgi:LmbE family N-acetylglucosaminyl deacetylase